MTKKRTRLCLGILALFASAIVAHAAETIPPKPDRYFNDYAGVVSPGAAQRFNEQLAQFERETSNQIVVAVWRKMPSQSSIEDFTQRTFRHGRSGKRDETMALSSSFSWMITGCESSRATGWKGRCPTSPATRLFATLLRRDSALTILKAALLLESISYLKQFAGSTREAEKRCGKVGAVRITLLGYSFSFSFWS
jgi:hypothetical protein